MKVNRRICRFLAAGSAMTCSLALVFAFAEGYRAADGFIKASSFGWNAEDATAALQAALDSGAKRVVVDDVGAPWNVQPVFIRRSNLEVAIASPAKGAAVRSLPKEGK